ESQDPEELKAAWKGWHAVGKGIRKNFERYVKLGNVGVNEMGFPDKSNLWRAQFDMPPDEFSKQVDQLWQELRPLYVELHAYVRTKLREKYGEKIVSVKGP
ncbi:M2 family metallopeptidase, partial [Stenotrophomonas sp. A3_2]|uniref:M2 family metallopeptidase n=1 Tax=Stenotrophomonas sp. A3_2 TaxID=3119978 RepID=UPI002FC34CCF